MKEIDAESLAPFVERRDELLGDLRANPRGLAWCDTHTAWADELILHLYRDAISLVDDPPVLSVVATGGYGRRELCPWSDIDLTLVPEEERDPRLESVVRRLFRALHLAFAKTLKIKVGYSYRLISDAPGLDGDTRTGLLDARLVAGAREPLDRLMREYWQSFPVAPFLLDKIDERRHQISRTSDSPHCVEPDLKSGAGGLRSFQAANWMGAAIGERMSRPGPEYDHVQKVRNLLHLVARRDHNLLNRSRRAEVAAVLQQDPLQMGSELAEAMSQLDDQYQVALEKIREARFSLSPGVVALRGEARIASDASLSDAALGIAHASDLDLDIAAIAAAPPAHRVGPEALVALGKGERTLRNLDRCGLLDALIPELAECRYLMPNDQSHRYTVFEHSMQVVRNLDEVPPGSLFESIRASLREPNVIYLVALLHDVGKRYPSKDHSIIGAEIAEEVCERWGLPSDTKDLVVWLIREHLRMSLFIRMRDVMLPETVNEFARIVQNQERLDHLTLLTWADTLAVDPAHWTQAQDTFCKELYERTSAALTESEGTEPDPKVHRSRFRKQLEKEEVSEEELEAFLQSLPAHYVLSTEPDLVRDHYRFAKKAEEGEPTVEMFDDPATGATEITVVSKDSPGTLNRILGVMYAHDISLIGIRATTTRSEPAIALDRFTATFGNKTVPRATARAFAKSLVQVLKGEDTAENVLKRKEKDPDRGQKVFSYRFYEGTPGIIEIRAPRGRGMPYRISRLITANGWNIIGARVGQWAGNGAAAFYVQSASRGSITPEEVDMAFAPQQV